MNGLVPVNLSVADAHAAAGLSTDAETLPAAPSVDQLDNWSQESYNLTIDAAASLGFPVGNVSAQYKSQALLFGSSRWRDITQGTNSYRFGVALRAIVVVTDIKGSGGLTLPVVAAKVEIEGARATAQLLVRGYKGNKLGETLPAWQSFGVDSYHDYMSAVSKIQSLIMEDEAGIEPELLATTVLSPQTPQKPSPAAAVGVVYALHGIAEGASLAHAIDKLGTDDSDVVVAVRTVYQDRLGQDERARPSPEQQQEARDQLGDIHVHHHWQEWFGR